MDSIEAYLAQIEDILEDSKNVPFSGKVAVDRDMIYEIIDELRLHLPEEIKEAQKVIDSRERYIKDAEKRSASIIDEAKQEAENILKDAENKAARLTGEHEIYKRAVEEGEAIIEDARQESKTIKINVIDYADEILSRAEQAIRQTSEEFNSQSQATQSYLYKIAETLYGNRQELRN